MRQPRNRQIDPFLGSGLVNIPVARQQILNNVTVELQQWKSCVFYMVRAERL
jgi:hypothetical protein